MKKSILIFAAIFLFQISFSFAQNKITNRLAEVIDSSADEPIQAIIILKDQYPIWDLDKQLYANKSSLQKRAFTVITELQLHSENSQKELQFFLDSKSKDEVISFKKYWITNAISIEATKDILIELSFRQDIDHIYLDDGIELVEPVSTSPSYMMPGHAEPGLKAINAHKMWELGFSGEGVIVANIDTGVEGDHAALVSNWRGNNAPPEQTWHDPAFGTTFPNDTLYNPASWRGHGTHTMGTMAGLDSENVDTIGVAFGAEWIAARHTGTATVIIENMEFMMDPDGNPGTTDDMPTVVNCSWSWLPPNCTNPFINAVLALESAGVAVLFVVGNFGPGPGTVTNPGKMNYNEMQVFSVGAVVGDFPELLIAPFSSRGPTDCTNGTGDQIKPEVSAPGFYVRSAYIGNSYQNMSGTSMATPHVAGAIALLKQAFPTKTGSELKQMLYETAQDKGIPGPDNDYGMGVIDVYQAYIENAVPENPRPSKNFEVYSDYTMTSSVIITWTDPTSLVNGNPLDNFEILILRDSLLIATVESGVESFNDSGLTDGQLYLYEIQTKDLNSENLSIKYTKQTFAGGSPIPSPPQNLVSNYSGFGDVSLNWTDPVSQNDGTPLDDLAKIFIYRGDDLIDSVDAGIQSYSDQGFLINNTNFYHLKSVDDEIPRHLSDFSKRDACFTGNHPDILVWNDSQEFWGSYKSLADSIFSVLNTLHLNGEIFHVPYITKNLFEYDDLSIFKNIFVVLGPAAYGVMLTEEEYQAIDAYISQGGNLYLESGLGFYTFPNIFGAPNIRPWFGLSSGSPDHYNVYELNGLNQLNDFMFEYSGPNFSLEEMFPNNSSVIWEGPSSGCVLGVFFDGYGNGKTVGVVPSFGGITDIQGQYDKVELMRIYLSLFDIFVGVENYSLNSDDQELRIYPNPVNHNAIIEFHLQEPEFVSLTIHNALGQKIANLVLEQLNTGIHKFEWNADGLVEGIYFCILKTSEGIQTRKIIMLD